MAALKYSKLKLELLKIDQGGYHLAISARVNGKMAHMLVDTGASQSVFDATRILRFFKGIDPEFHKNPQLSAGLGTSNLESHTIMLNTFTLGCFRARSFPVILLDLANINQSYASIGLKPIDGVIGSDLLLKLKAQINLRSLTLKVFC